MANIGAVEETELMTVVPTRSVAVKVSQVTRAKINPTMAKVAAAIASNGAGSSRNGAKHHITTAVHGMLMEAPMAGATMRKPSFDTITAVANRKAAKAANTAD